MNSKILIFLLMSLFFTGWLEAKSLLQDRPLILGELDRIHQSFFDQKEVTVDRLIGGLQRAAIKDGSLKPALNAAESLKTATSEKEKLEAYAVLAESLQDYIQKDESSGVHVFYCPMVKKKWIASGDKIQNPYDPSMKGCGKKI
ncbi:hypothetical protein AB3N59_10815 [Leptospira sp. WS92.C1]